MTTTDAPSLDGRTRRGGSRGWLWLLLIASLALNLLIVGAIAGVGFARRTDRALGGQSGETSLMSFVQSLSPERQKAARQLARSRQGAVAPLRQEARQSRMAAGRAFLAEPFDAAAYRAAQERVIAAETALRRSQIEFQSTLAASMSAAERREFLSWRNVLRQRRGLPPEAVPGVDEGPAPSPPKDGG